MGGHSYRSPSRPRAPGVFGDDHIAVIRAGGSSDGQVRASAVRGVDAGLRRPVRPAAASHPERRGRPLGDLARADRRRVLRRGRAHGAGRSRHRDRVPAHRGDARRAEGAAPAAGPRRRRSRRGADALRGARPPARPPPRVQDVPGRGQVLHEQRSPSAQPLGAAYRRARGAVPLARARSARAGRRSTRCSPRRDAGLAPKPQHRGATDHVAPIRASVRDAIETVLALLPRSRRGAASATSPSASTEKLEVIVRFLAVLELFKQGVVDLEQVESFGELIVRAARPRRAGRCSTSRSIDELGRRDRARRRHACPSRPTSTRRGARVSDRNGGRCRSARARSRRSCWRRPSRCTPTVLAQLLELPVDAVEELCDAARRRVRGAKAAVPARAGRRRLPLPDPSRRAPVRRALRARRPDRAAVGPGARDARDHRLQAADRAGAALGDPGVNVDATLKTLVARGLHRGDRHEHTPGQSRRCSRTTTLFLERLGLDSLDELPALADFVPDASIWWRRSNAVCGCLGRRRARQRRANPPSRSRPSAPTRTVDGKSAAHDEGERLQKVLARRASGRGARASC